MEVAMALLKTLAQCLGRVLVLEQHTQSIREGGENEIIS